MFNIEPKFVVKFHYTLSPLYLGSEVKEVAYRSVCFRFKADKAKNTSLYNVELKKSKIKNACVFLDLHTHIMLNVF